MSDGKKIPSFHRASLTLEVNEALRRVNAQLVLLSDTVARCVGLHPTDLQCLDLLRITGPTTASTLASSVGLTTGAMTAVIDRLENASLVRRERTADDRRRVLVHVVPARVKPIEELYEPLAKEMARLERSFSNDQLATVLEYLTRTLESCAQHVNRLQRLAGARRVTRDERRRLPGAPASRPNVRAGSRASATRQGDR